jgi:hypothetical protein
MDEDYFTIVYFNTYIFALGLCALTLSIYVYFSNNSKFDNIEIFKAYILSCLIYETFIDIFVVWMYSDNWDLDIIIYVAYICAGLGSFKMVDKYRKKITLISRFFLGYLIAYNVLPLFPPGPLDSTLNKILIGVLFSQITSLTFLHLILILIAENFFPTFYKAFISITSFVFFNSNICLSIIYIFIATFMIPKLTEYEEILN